MSFLKNYQRKLYNLANKTFHNLNNKQCESSCFILLSCNINVMDLSQSSSSKMDEDCYIVDDSELNNITVPTTAVEAAGAASVHVNSCSGPDLPNLRQRGAGYKESTSINLTNRQHSTIQRTSQSNLVVNPINVSHFLNWQSFYQSRGLSTLNVAPPSSHFYKQRNCYSTQRFRNVSLFSEQDTVSYNTQPGQPGRNIDGNGVNWRALKEKEIIDNLRTWVPVDETLGPNGGVHFTLMSYNVLAQDLLVEHQYLYKNHKPRDLLWENRWKNLYREILKHNPDIICLQEVQEDHLRKYFSQFLQKGYANLYKKKTGMRSDGCAIYYKTSLFKLLENTTVEYNQEYSVLDRDNVAIIAKFASVNNPEAEFVVATTHLLYNPRREDVRLAQTQVLFSEIDRIAYKGEENNLYSPIIITGDFNSEPQSAVYRLIVNGSLRYDILSNRTLKETNFTDKMEGKVLIPSTLRITDNCQHLDLLNRRSAGEKLTRSEELKLINLRHNKRQRPKEVGTIDIDDSTLFSTGVLSHDLNLQSAFLHRTHNDTEGTTFQDGWITVDYIFYSGGNKDFNTVNEEKLKLISRYTIPTSAELSSKVRYIPNFALGSDHLALLAKFKLEY